LWDAVSTVRTTKTLERADLDEMPGVSTLREFCDEISGDEGGESPAGYLIGRAGVPAVRTELQDADPFGNTRRPTIQFGPTSRLVFLPWPSLPT
jgi:hypothetical protein